MADGGRWVNVPGKGRRFLTDKGEYRYGDPSAPLAGFARGVKQFFTQPGNITPEQLRQMTAPGLTAPTGSFSASAERQGPYVPDRIRNAPAAPGLPTPIVSGIDSSGAVDRRQSDLYRQYAQTPEGQFERYFQSSEMDPYFGAASRGAGAPKDLQATLALAGQAKAPTDVPLSAYYRAQSAAGRGAMPEVVGGLTQGLEGEKAKAMEAWAKANPMLAYREFNKRQAAAPVMPMAPDQQTMMGDSGSRAQSEGGYTMEAFNPTGFSGAANAVPAPWNTQGQAVSAPYTEAMSRAFEKTNPMNLVSQQPIEMNNEIGARVQDFLKRRGQ